jgi:aspartate kinase
VFRVLANEGINIEVINTSPIKITCLIRADAVDQAVNALHNAFDLSASDVKAESGLGQAAR